MRAVARREPARRRNLLIAAYCLPKDYYGKLAAFYQHKRDIIVNELAKVGFTPYLPKGPYYVLCDISAFGTADDTGFANRMVEEIGVAAVPGSSFYFRRELGRNKIRFAFCKTEETLRAAILRLEKLGR